MALRGLWDKFPGDCGGEAESMSSSAQGQREKGGSGVERLGGNVQSSSARVAKLCHASRNKWSVVDQRDEGRPLNRHFQRPKREPVSLVGWLHVAG